MVGINEVLHDDVVKDLALLFNHLIENRVSILAQEEERGYLDPFKVVLIPPRLSDRLAGIKFFMGGADEDNKERNAFLTFVGLVYKKFKRMWVYRSSSYVAKGEVFPGHGQMAERLGASVGRSRASYTQVPESTSPAHNCQNIQTGDLGSHCLESTSIPNIEEYAFLALVSFHFAKAAYY